MSGIITISDLPPELLYTVLSQALADILFDYLFVGALLPNNNGSSTPSIVVEGGLNEITSLATVSITWRLTVQRILGAILLVQTRPIQDYNVQSLTKKHQTHRAHQLTITKAYPSVDDLSASTIINANSTCLITHYQSILRIMQTTLRVLIQHSIDMYRSEQDAMSVANQTGVTTPTLLPVPVPVPIPVPQHPITMTVGTPLSINLHHSIPPVSNPPPPITNGQGQLNTNTNTNTNINPNPHRNVNSHFFSALLLIATQTLKEYTDTPLFQDALCYSQAAIFTCESSNSFGCTNTRRNGWKSTADGGVRVRRPDVSTLVLTTSRLIIALEWVGTREDGGGGVFSSTGRMRICPREVGDVVGDGMREVRERIEDAIRVCRWNDLLDAVFLHGERSEEMLEALDGCFDELEANAGSIQMHHLLRSNLFKTIQTIARLGPINTPAPASASVYLNTSTSNTSTSNTPSHSNLHTPSHCGEVWRSRAGALAFRWMGRVVEWTGL